MKMKSENDSENDHFCKIEGRDRFYKNDHLSIHFCLILKSIFEKMGLKMKLKMSPKLPKNGYREQP